MPFAISPDHMAEDFEGEMTIEDKVEVFISRAKGWQLQPAMDMREQGIPHRGFAQLLIVISYFEMIGKYRAGFIGEGESSKHFKEGLLYTFSDISQEETELLDAFYKNVRNGLYHVGMTRPKVIISDAIPKSFGFNEELGVIAISSDPFVEDLQIRFDVFADELRNEKNELIRRNFMARFDDDNGLEA